MRRFTVAEICAGAGGQSLGLHLAGFDHAVAVELDPTAAETLGWNLARVGSSAHQRLGPAGLAELVRVGDVADETVWRPEAYAGIDLLAGGVPCPPFSDAGKQLGAEDERDLFAFAVELAGRMRPRAVLLENVRGLSRPRFAGYRQAVIDRFDEMGYVADWQLLEARNFGVPQLRPRFVLVALLPEDADYFRWPTGEPTDSTVGSTLVDLMGANGWLGANDWAVKADGIAPTIVGGSKKHGGADLGPTRAKLAWRGLGVDAHGVADAAPSESMPTHHVPKLTCEMVARLQGWNGPEYEWHFSGRKTARYRQIGNAFPPPVARAVGEALIDAFLHRGERARTAPERQLHDEVYRLLRDQRRPITSARIAELLRGALSPEEVELRIKQLSRDFVIDLRDTSRGPAWVLGEFKAFRGQDDHGRHEAFALGRSRIS